MSTQECETRRKAQQIHVLRQDVTIRVDRFHTLGPALRLLQPAGMMEAIRRVFICASSSEASVRVVRLYTLKIHDPQHSLCPSDGVACRAAVSSRGKHQCSRAITPMLVPLTFLVRGFLVFRQKTRFQLHVHNAMHRPTGEAAK